MCPRRIVCFFASLLFLVGSVAAAAAWELPGDNSDIPVQSDQSQPTDTVYLKNGSILHGLVVDYKNEMFTIVIPGTLSRAMIHVSDVDRIEFAEALPPPANQPPPESPPEGEQQALSAPPSGASDQASGESQPTESPPTSEPTAPAETGAGTESATPAETPATGEPTEGQAATPTPPSSEPTTPAETPATGEPTEGRAATPTSSPEPSAAGASEETPATAQPPKVRTVMVKVSGRDVWADSGVDVQRGTRLRLSASGQVNLSDTLSTGPEGVSIADPRKMMADRPTGGLIAVIGDDNDDFIFIGTAAEFVAQRSGRLFLMVNEDNLDDNSGAFDVRIEVEPAPEPNSP